MPVSSTVEFEVSSEEISEIRERPIHGPLGVLAQEATPVWALTDDFPTAYYTEALGNLPEPEWIIPNVLERSGITFVVGDFGTGKTFLAIDWSLSLACGLPAWGEWELPKEPQRVLYILAEGQSWLNHRIQEWYAHHPGSRPGENLIWVPEALNLFSRDGRSADLQRLSNAAADFKPDLIVADTFARVTAGANENQQQDMSIVVGAMDTIRNRSGASIMFLHHANREGNYRGSTVLPGAADVVLSVRRHGEAEDAPLEMGWIKLKNAAPPTDRPWFRIAPGQFSGYVELLGTPEAKPRRGSRQEAVLRWLEQREEPFTPQDVAASVFADLDNPTGRLQGASKVLLALAKQGVINKLDKGRYEVVVLGE